MQIPSLIEPNTTSRLFLTPSPFALTGYFSVFVGTWSLFHHLLLRLRIRGLCQGCPAAKGNSPAVSS